MSFWTEPSPSDFQAWEERLVRGEDPSCAAMELGYTSGAFKRADRARHVTALAVSREVRAATITAANARRTLRLAHPDRHED